MPGFYSCKDGELILECHLQPWTSSDAIVGLQGGNVKTRIAAPPIEGRANAHLIKFLATQFGVTKGAISILNGELVRQKRVRIEQPSKMTDMLSIEHAEIKPDALILYRPCGHLIIDSDAMLYEM